MDRGGKMRKVRRHRFAADAPVRPHSKDPQAEVSVRIPPPHQEERSPAKPSETRAATYSPQPEKSDTPESPQASRRYSPLAAGEASSSGKGFSSALSGESSAKRFPMLIYWRGLLTAWARKKIAAAQGGIEEYFGDERFRTERILLVTVIPAVILLVVLVFAFLLLTKQNDKPYELLTADKVEGPLVPPRVLTPLEEGEAALEAMDYAGAREAFGRVEGQDRPKALLRLAHLDRLDENHQQAIAHLDETLAETPEALAFFLRGDSHRALGDMEKAVEDIKKATELASAEPAYANAHLLLQMQMGKAREVAENIRVKQSLGLGSTEANWSLAAAAFALARNDSEIAAAMLRRAYGAMSVEMFDLLMSYPVMKQFEDKPEAMPYYIKSSTARRGE